MNENKYAEEIEKIKEFIGTNPRLSIIIAIVLIIILIIILRYVHIRNQYSDEAWKIRKKNGKKSIFWYDEYGNKTYKKPKKSKIPSRHKRGL